MSSVAGYKFLNVSIYIYIYISFDEVNFQFIKLNLNVIKDIAIQVIAIMIFAFFSILDMAPILL